MLSLEGDNLTASGAENRRLLEEDMEEGWLWNGLLQSCAEINNQATP